MKYLLIALFLPLFANAQIAFGVKSKEPAILIHDFIQNDVTKEDIFGLTRYGIGRGQLELSERPSILMENRSGVFLSPNTLTVGLEIGAGKITYRGRPTYNWEPAASFGPRVDAGLFSFYFGPRAGLSYDTRGNDTLAGGFIGGKMGKVQYSYIRNDYYKLKDSLVIHDLVVDHTYNLQYQVDRGQELYYAGVKFNYF